jgi:hypothetical protein
MYYKNKYDYATEHLSGSDEVHRFCKHYEAQVELTSNKLYAKRRPIHYQDWISDGSGSIPFDLKVEREPMVQIHMPQDEFKNLVEKERWYGRLEQEADYYKRIVEQYRNDERVRDSNPSVQKAWEKYLMLLELAR